LGYGNGAKAFWQAFVRENGDYATIAQSAEVHRKNNKTFLNFAPSWLRVRIPIIFKDKNVSREAAKERRKSRMEWGSF